MTNEQLAKLNEIIGKYACSERNPCGVIFGHRDGKYFIADDQASEELSEFDDLCIAAQNWKDDFDANEPDDVDAVRSVVNGDERCEHTGMTRDELESICGTGEPDEDGEGYDEDWEDSLGRLPTPLSVLRHHVSGAIERGQAVAIVEQPLPTITEVIRNVNNGDCTLSAIRSDGSKIKLFSYYVDELAFADSELIGLTETQAHELHRKRDTAYLRS